MKKPSTILGEVIEVSQNTRIFVQVIDLQRKIDDVFFINLLKA